MYRGTIATDCMFIVTESMKVAIGHVEKNETIREAYLLFRSDVTKSFDLLEEFIKLNGFKDVDAIRNRVKRYEHEYRYYIKVIIEAVKVHYEEQKKITPEAYPEPIPTAEKIMNFVIHSSDLTYGSLKDKLQTNLNVLEFIKSGNPPITTEKQQLLVKYSGWGGGLPGVFNETSDKFLNERQRLKALLTPEEYEYAKAGTLCEHFTPYEVIDFMYKALQVLGFKGGKTLDPALGTGNFIGIMPQNWQGDLTGIDINPLNCEISKGLYPDIKVINLPFEKTSLQSDYELVVTNVPFGDFTVYDENKNERHLIHDYFILKSIELLKDGGICALITSSGTMDKKNTRLREKISENARMIAAVRLPNVAFKKSANTEVTTDILFFQKYEQGGSVSFINTESDPVTNIAYNEYFIKNPHMMLGTMEKAIKLYGVEQTTLVNKGDWISDLYSTLQYFTDFELLKVKKNLLLNRQ